MTSGGRPGRAQAAVDRLLVTAAAAADSPRSIDGWASHGVTATVLRQRYFSSAGSSVGRFRPAQRRTVRRRGRRRRSGRIYKKYADIALILVVAIVVDDGPMMMMIRSGVRSGADHAAVSRGRAADTGRRRRGGGGLTLHVRPSDATTAAAAGSSMGRPSVQGGSTPGTIFAGR